jgi:hypothetical protein
MCHGEVKVWLHPAKPVWTLSSAQKFEVVDRNGPLPMHIFRSAAIPAATANLADQQGGGREMIAMANRTIRISFTQSYFAELFKNQEQSSMIYKSSTLPLVALEARWELPRVSIEGRPRA